MTLHGVTRELSIQANAPPMGDMLRGFGEFPLRQTDFGIKLVSVAGGTPEGERRAASARSTSSPASRGDDATTDQERDGSGDCHMCLAIPGKIVELVPGGSAVGGGRRAGVRRRVELGLLEDDDPEPGDWVLIHVGFAMSKISEEDAIDQMRMLAALGEAEAAIEEVRGYGLGEGRTDGRPARDT